MLAENSSKCGDTELLAWLSILTKNDTEFEIKIFLLSHRHITHMKQNWSTVYNISECLNSNNNANLSGLNSTKHMTADHNNVQIKLRQKFNKRSAVKQEDFLRVVSMNSISDFHISHIPSSMNLPPNNGDIYTWMNVDSYW